MDIEWHKVFEITELIKSISIGLFCSLLFLCILFWLRPKISISPNISKQFDAELREKIYVFKIVNKSLFFRAYDIKIQLMSNKTEDNINGPNTWGKQIDLSSDCFWLLPRLNVRHLFQDTLHKENELSSPTDYAYQICAKEDLSEIIKSDTKFLTVKVMAKHSLSGFSKVFVRHYKHQNKIIEGKFLSGNSFKIIKENN